MSLTCKLTKKPTASAKAVAKATTPPTGFNLQDNGDNTYTVLGVDAAGNTTDISAVATLSPAPTSDATAVVTVDAPTGMTYAVHAASNPAPAVGATANVTITATWNDGSVGPFTIVEPYTITASPISGIAVTAGTPTVH